MLKTKKILTAVLSAVIAICAAIALLPVKKALAQESALPEITMEKGPAVRIADDGNADLSGIRYSFSMSASDYDALSKSSKYTDVKYGVFIAAASYNSTGKEIADETHLIGSNAIYYWQVGTNESGEPVYNVTPTADMRRIICAEGDAMAVKADGKAYFYGSVVKMKDENLRREYIGVGYLKYVENGETHYKFATANDNVRSIEYVAREAYKANPELRDRLVALYLNKVAHDCVVKTAPVAAEGLVADGETRALVTEGVADDYSEMRYSLDNKTFSADVPTAALAGEYTVWYKAVARMPFDHDSEVKSVVVTIAEIPDDVITLKPAKITETKKDGKWTFGGTYDYKGLGAYNVGDVLTFRFKGKNIPNVGLFVDKNGVNPIGGGTENTGLFVQTSGHGWAEFNKRLIISGPYLVEAGGPEYYPGAAGYPAYREWVSANYEMGVDVSYEVDGGKFSLFGIDFLDDNTDYVYRITTAKTASAATVTLNFTLNSVSGGTETQVTTYSKTVTHLLPSLENRFAVAYGTGDLKNGRTITFEATIETPAESNEITLQPAAVTETMKDGVLVGFGGTYDYKGLGEYKVGDALEFTFKGRNIPNVGLFVNKNGVNPIGGGKENTGLFVQTSGHGAVTYNKRLYITGPYLVDAGGAEYYSDISGFKYNGWLGANKEMGVDISYGDKLSLFGIEMLDENTNYVYRIESSDGTDKQVTLKFILYTVNEAGERTEVANFVKTVTHLLPSLENRYAVVYGAGDYYSKNSNVYTGKQITFSYEVKKAA